MKPLQAMNATPISAVTPAVTPAVIAGLLAAALLALARLRP